MPDENPLAQLNLPPDEGNMKLLELLSRPDFERYGRLLGRKGVELDDVELKKLCRQISDSCDSTDELLCLRALVILIDHGNHSGLWDLCIPRFPGELKYERTPYTPDRNRWLSKLALWRNKLNDAAGRDLQLASMELGRFFLSAIVYGGLHHHVLVQALSRLCGTALQKCGELVWVDLSLPWAGNPDAELRRWFPDPLTELLMARLSPSAIALAAELVDAKKPSKAIFEVVRRFMKSEGIASKDIPRNLSLLMAMANLGLSVEINGLVAGYCRRAVVSHSIWPDAFARLQKRQIPYALRSDAKTAHLEVPEPLPISTADSPWVGQLYDALSTGDRKLAMQKVQALRHCREWPEDVIPTLLFDWAIQMLTGGTRKDKRPKPVTLRGFTSAVGTRMAGLLGANSLRGCSPQELCLIYAEVLDTATSARNRRNIARALAEFHYFLTIKFGIGSIDEQESLGITMALEPVDARIVSFDEYNAFLDAVRNDSALAARHPDFLDIASLLLTLGFKCGLRRNEGLLLLMQDIHFLGEVAIIIRPNAYRGLKTKNCVRIIPAQALLIGPEVELLRAWHKHRISSGARPEDPLFVIKGKTIDENFMIGWLHEVMRRVSGDPLIRYHHFRHSCATWTTLALSFSHLKEIPELFPEQPATMAYLRDGIKLRMALFQSSHPSRRDMYQVADILGHRGPDMSLEHYVHALDFIWLSRAPNPLKCLPAKTLIQLSGIPERTVFKYRLHEDPAALLKEARKRHLAGQRIVETFPVAASMSNSFDADSVLPKGFELWRRIWNLMAAVDKDPGYVARSAKDGRASIGDLPTSFAVEVIKQARQMQRDIAGNPRGRLKPLLGAARGQIRAWPKKTEDLDVMRQIADGFHAASWNLDAPLHERLSIGDVLVLYAKKVWLTEAGQVFGPEGNQDCAMAYIHLLRKVGYADSLIQAMCFDSASASTQKAWGTYFEKRGFQFSARDFPPPRSGTYSRSVIIKALSKSSLGMRESASLRLAFQLALLQLRVEADTAGFAF